MPAEPSDPGEQDAIGNGTRSTRCPCLTDEYRIDAAGDIVHSHGPGTEGCGQRRDRIRCHITAIEWSRGAISIGEQCTEEPLARGSDQHRVTHRRDFRKGAQQCPVVLGILGKADARIDDDRFGSYAGAKGRLHPFAELSHHLGDHVGVLGEVRHPIAVPTPVHDDVGHLHFGDRGGHLGIGQSPTDVVHQAGSGGNRSLGDLRAHGVDTRRHPGS